MLFYAAFAAIIAGVLFLVNGTTWFDGEENLAVPLIVIGAVIIALQIVLSVLAVRRFARERDRLFNRFDRF